MRIYVNFPEAVGEIQRDLKEMGVRVVTNSYQDKIVKGNPDYETLELQNYIYTVTDPHLIDLAPDQPWADAEFSERISGFACNPGKAWTLRAEVWREFIEPSGEFGYTYAERLSRGKQLEQLIFRLKTDPEARQHYLTIWNAFDIQNAGGKHRIPCSLGYLFQIRDNALHITYLQRSCDFALHFINDIYLAHMLQAWVAGTVEIRIGRFIHWIGSMHVFNKDVAGVF